VCSASVMARLIDCFVAPFNLTLSQMQCSSNNNKEALQPLAHLGLSRFLAALILPATSLIDPNQWRPNGEPLGSTVSWPPVCRVVQVEHFLQFRRQRPQFVAPKERQEARKLATVCSVQCAVWRLLAVCCARVHCEWPT